MSRHRARHHQTDTGRSGVTIAERPPTALDQRAAHAFEPGGADHLDKLGRRVRTCRICGRVGRGGGHRFGVLRPEARDPLGKRPTRAKVDISDRLVAFAEPRKREPTRVAVPVDHHPFEPGQGVMVTSGGKLMPTCNRCQKAKNSPRHRVNREDHVSLPRPSVLSHPRQPATARRAGVKALPPAELVELAIAVDRVLALPELAVSWRLRHRAGELRELLDVPSYPVLWGPDAVEAEPDPDSPPVVAIAAVPALARRPQEPAKGVGQSGIVKGIRNDRVRKLATRAIESGFVASHTGGGHIALDKGDTRLILSTTANGSRMGHGWMNLRASAKRAGINVEGL